MQQAIMQQAMPGSRGETHEMIKHETENQHLCQRLPLFLMKSTRIKHFPKSYFGQKGDSIFLGYLLQ